MTSPRLRLLALAASFAVLSCSEETELPVEGASAAERASFELPDFELIERSGDAVGKETLLGAPWIAGFAFTNCAGPCPRLSGVMASVQQRLSDTTVRLVTVSVDPERDTPEVLRTYAESFGADSERWLFLTGRKDSIYELIQKGFRLGVQEDPGALPGEEVAHSTRLVLVDADGVVQGYFSSETEDAVDRLVARARALAKDAR